MKYHYFFYIFLTLSSYIHAACNPDIETKKWQTETDRFGSTLLHNTVAYGYFDIVTSLLRQHFSVNMQNNFGETPLHINAAQGDWNITKLLLAYNPDISIKNNAKKTPLDIALEKKHHDIAQLLSAYLQENKVHSSAAQATQNNM